MAHHLLDRVALALQGIVAHVISEVVGKTSRKPQSGLRPPAHPQGSVWAHLGYAVRSLRRAAARARLAPGSASPDASGPASGEEALVAAIQEIERLSAEAQSQLDHDDAADLKLTSLPRLPPAPQASSTREAWVAWWAVVSAPAPGGALTVLRSTIPRVAARAARKAAKKSRTSRRRARRLRDFKTFWSALRQPSAGSGLRPSSFIPPAEHPGEAPPPARACASPAERLEGADQSWAWMHDEQPTFPAPAFLTSQADPPPAPVSFIS